MEESRVDVKTGNEEEESLEEGVEVDKNSKISDTLITGVGVLFVSKIVVQGNIF